MSSELYVGRTRRTTHMAVLAVAFGLLWWWATPVGSQDTDPQQVNSYAIVARADKPVDALAASSAAGQLGAPVYLTFPSDLDEQAAEGLQATDPDVVVLAGGTAALSETVERPATRRADPSYRRDRTDRDRQTAQRTDRPAWDQPARADRWHRHR